MDTYVRCRCLWLPKAGRSDEEYEDAFWPRREYAYPVALAPRFAVADGATESSFARRWARQLVVAYCSRRTPAPADREGFRQQVERQGAGWMRCVFARPLAWNFLEKAQRGAFATLTGVTFTAGEDGSGRWDALAVGDSCLFQVRGGELVDAFPAMDADAFGFHPQLLCSVSGSNAQVWEEWEECLRTGAWQAGDLFLLMTDALARWFAEMRERGDRPWETLLSAAASPAVFQEWVEQRRAEQAMNNDDVTLMLLCIEEGA